MDSLNEQKTSDISRSEINTDRTSITAIPATPTAHMPSTNPPSPSNASISTRTYIYHLPYPIPPGTPIPYSPHLPAVNPLNLPSHTFEPTHTLVLTSATKSFLDIRIFKPIQTGDTDLPNDGGHHERLDWAFAGKSASREIQDPYTAASGGSYGPVEGERTWYGSVTHASWTHWLDSRHAAATPTEQIPIDEGIMYPLTSSTTLEHGSGLNPHTNSMYSYEEFWTDLPIYATYPSTSRYSIVLRLSNPAHNIRGIIIRLGQFCQGMLMVDSNTTIERWVFEERTNKDGNAVDGDWKRVARIGDAFLPCATTFKPEILVLGGAVKYFDYEWTVEERIEWRNEEAN